jgi:site-specific DNA-methyltransferase (adenine-specific)
MKVELHLGDCLDVMRSMPDKSVDTCITDPPYELGFMGKKWDSSGIAFQPETWQAVYRVLKPGAILLAFGGTRTFHRLVVAIEDAGFEIRDTIAWVYGSGFPKSYDISKGIDKQAGAEREVVGDNPNFRPVSGKLGYLGEHNFRQTDGMSNLTAPSTPEAQLWDGWGTALKPAFEPIVVAMKPIDGTFVNNALTWGVAGLWIDGGRVGYEQGGDAASNPLYRKNNGYKTDYGVDENPTSYALKDEKGKMNINSQGRFPANLILSYPEDEYELRDDVTPSQLMELARWFDENA